MKQSHVRKAWLRTLVETIRREAGMDVGALVGTSGPLAALAAIAGFFLKAYMEKRKGDRESESGIVETTKETLRIVRDQMVQMEQETQNLRTQITELEARLRAKDVETRHLQSQVAEFETQLRGKDKTSRPQPKGRASLPSQRSPLSDVAKEVPNPGLS
jgi:predicted RNase H-like nuclease (RuvC/YqgF family)